MIAQFDFIVNKVNNNVARFFAKQGVDVAGETLEETISDIGEEWFY